MRRITGGSKRGVGLVVLFILRSIAAQTGADSGEVTATGPERGTLLLAGGSIKSDAIFDRFIELAGGKEASIVVVPTARGEAAGDGDQGDFLRTRGVTNVTVLHTDDPVIADREDFVVPLKKATAIWFHGGRQWRLVDAYSGTRTERAFREVLNRGGVIGGSSAGATIQGSYLVRGDTRNNQIMMGDHEEGFAYLKNTAVDQHVLARNRHFDLFNILKRRPELLGLGIDEDTAIEVAGDQFVVLGSSYVLVYDGRFWSREGWDLKELPDPGQLFYCLREGDRYDLKKRTVIVRE